MRILMLDENESSVPHFCDLLGAVGAEVVQAKTKEEFVTGLQEREFDLLILDLMIPDPDFSDTETDAGYTTGVAIYRSLGPDLVEGIPFLILTAATVETSFIAKKIKSLEARPTFLGVYKKGRDDEELVRFIRQRVQSANQ